jgi:tryptophan synthase alpha chain
MGKLLVAYTTLGFPNKDLFLESLKILDSEIDYLELGLPPNYAKYDGPIIRKSYYHVKKLYKDEEFINLIYEARNLVKKPIILLTYLEEWKDKFNNLINLIKNNNIDGILLPDLIIDFIDEYEKYLSILKRNGINVVLFVTPTVPDNIIKQVSKLSDYFTYYGIRPTTGISLPIDIKILLSRVRRLVDGKLIVGFGLSGEKEIVEALKGGADGIAIGSSIVEILEKYDLDKLRLFIKKMRYILNE